MEQEVVVLGEVQPEDPGHMLACGGRDLFKEDILPVSQLVMAVNAPTQEDLVVPARSLKVEAILQPLDIPCWAAESDPDVIVDPCLPSMEVQEQGQEDPSLSPTPVEPPLGQGNSRQEFEQGFHQSEPSDQRVWEYVWEAQRRASHPGLYLWS